MTIKAVVFDAYGTLYDIQSVAAVTEQSFPGYGDIITQVWRIKQLEYTWLRTMMNRYEDFATVTRESLIYTLKALDLRTDAATVAPIMEKYLHLDLYPEAKDALAALPGRKLAILSNGSPDMLNALVRNTGLDAVLDATISIDGKRRYKPSPEAYELIEEQLGVKPAEVLFVSSNPFDVNGAKAFGLQVAWIERVKAGSLASEVKADAFKPLTMFKLIRMQTDQLGFEPDFRISSLIGLQAIVVAGQT